MLSNIKFLRDISKLEKKLNKFTQNPAIFNSYIDFDLDKISQLKKYKSDIEQMANKEILEFPKMIWQFGENINTLAASFNLIATKNNQLEPIQLGNIRAQVILKFLETLETEIQQEIRKYNIFSSSSNPLKKSNLELLRHYKKDIESFTDELFEKVLIDENRFLCSETLSIEALKETFAKYNASNKSYLHEKKGSQLGINYEAIMQQKEFKRFFEKNKHDYAWKLFRLPSVELLLKLESAFTGLHNLLINHFPDKVVWHQASSLAIKPLPQLIACSLLESLYHSSNELLCRQVNEPKYFFSDVPKSRRQHTLEFLQGNIDFIKHLKEQIEITANEGGFCSPESREKLTRYYSNIQETIQVLIKNGKCEDPQLGSLMLPPCEEKATRGERKISLT